MPFASLDDFSITPVWGTKLYRLNDEVVYFSSKYSDEPIVLKKGIESDGSTIPKWSWWFVGHPLEGYNGICGFLHDDICRKKMFPRKICDLIFLEAHESVGTPKWNRNTQYRSVRLNSIIKGYE